MCVPPEDHEFLMTPWTAPTADAQPVAAVLLVVAPMPLPREEPPDAPAD